MAIVTLGSVLAARALVAYSYRQVAEEAAQLKTARDRKIQATNERAQHVSRPDFTQRLPFAAHAEMVVSRATHRAQELGIQVTSISVERRPAMNGELGQSRVSLAITASYPALKTWLSEMQERDEALAVENLVLRRSTDTLQEAQVLFVLFTRD